MKRTYSARNLRTLILRNLPALVAGAFVVVFLVVAADVATDGDQGIATYIAVGSLFVMVLVAFAIRWAYYVKHKR